MAQFKKKIYVFGSTMWDIVGKPSETMKSGKDCSGLIYEGPGGVAFNVTLGLSKILDKSSFELSLVSALGKNSKSKLIQKILEKNSIKTKYLIMKGDRNDQYLSIETKNGEIFGSINSTTNFLSNQTDLIRSFNLICSAHKRTRKNATLIFDGNCTRKFLDYVKEEACEEIFTKYFIPANFSKLAEFKSDAIYFKGFNLFINLEEAKILMGTKNLHNSEEASKAIFNKIKTEQGLAVVTDGPNTACGISNKEVVKVQPNIIKGNISRLGAGDAFFALFLSHKELNPDASLKKNLNLANEKIRTYLKTNDQKIY